MWNVCLYVHDMAHRSMNHCSRLAAVLLVMGRHQHVHNSRWSSDPDIMPTNHVNVGHYWVKDIKFW